MKRCDVCNGTENEIKEILRELQTENIVDVCVVCELELREIQSRLMDVKSEAVGKAHKEYVNNFQVKMETLSKEKKK